MDIYTDTLVVYAPIGDAKIEPLYPKRRYKEITECKSEKAKCEKYWVWKLLEKVVLSELNYDFANLQFTKTDNGQWICPDFYFSLSHSDGLVCVAISRCPVGVDAERIRPLREEIGAKILTEREAISMSAMPPEDRGVYLLLSWVKKESIFKMGGGKALLPNRTEADDERTMARRVSVRGAEYFIALSTESKEQIEFKYMEEI